MRKNIEDLRRQVRSADLFGRLRSGVLWRQPKSMARVALGSLLVLNFAAALNLFKPWGGSAEDLALRQVELQQQVLQRRATLKRSEGLAGKVEQARAAGDAFMARYMLDSASAYSTIVGELDKAAEESGIKPKESSLSVEPIEGSDTLSMMTISAGFEANYNNLTKFIHILDKSSKFLIIESLQAAPKPSGDEVSAIVKLNLFVRDNPNGVPPPSAEPAPAVTPAPQVQSLPQRPAPEVARR